LPFRQFRFVGSIGQKQRCLSHPRVTRNRMEAYAFVPLYSAACYRQMLVYCSDRLYSPPLCV
jgi:hypothetical protein